MTFGGKTYWLIGASEGLGRALATRLDAQGASLILSARRESALIDLCSALQHAKPLAIDVTDLSAVAAAAEEIGDIDGVVYCAGAYEPMPATDWDTERALMMSDVNYLGALRVIGAVLPRMLSRRAGHIVLIGSLSAYRGLPKAVGYGASKAAMRSLAETLRHDLKGTGVRVQLVNPGFIKTRLTAKNDFAMPQLMPPQKAAEHVMRAMGRKRFRTDFPRPFSWAIRTYSALPDWLVYLSKK